MKKMTPEDFGIKVDTICAVGVNITDIPTGEWRQYDPVIDHEKCIMCGQCVLYCPVKCVTVKDEKMDINYRYCKGCGICVVECPKEAISFDKEGGRGNG